MSGLFFGSVELEGSGELTIEFQTQTFKLMI